MMLSPGLRKAALTLHVVATVGWLGTVTAFLALAVAGLQTGHAQLARGIYLAMDVITRFTIVPLCFAALLTGVVQSLGTSWGLFRHYWIVIKLIITIISTGLLLVHTQPLSALSEIATLAPIEYAANRAARLQLVVDAGAALAALVFMTALSIVKPRGLTRYGRRVLRLERAPVAAAPPSMDGDVAL